MDLEQTLRGFGRGAERAALLLDFDGSLSSIVDDPSHAVPFPGVAAALDRVIPLVRTVAVVSGRPIDFLQEQLPLDGLVYSGQYGLERSDGRSVIVDDRAAPFAAMLDALADRAEHELTDVLVERKGTIALALHWRTAPERDSEARAWARKVALESGLSLFPGRMVVELRPPISADKGTAVEALAGGLEWAAFVGDDEADLAAFDTLDRLEDSGKVQHAIRVAVISDEAPIQLLDRADLQVAGPQGVSALLSTLASTITAERA